MREQSPAGLQNVEPQLLTAQQMDVHLVSWLKTTGLQKMLESTLPSRKQLKAICIFERSEISLPVSPRLKDFFIRCFSSLLPAKLTSWAQIANMGSVKGRFCTLKVTAGS